MSSTFKPATPTTVPSRIPKTAVKPSEQVQLTAAARDKARVDFRVEDFRRSIRTKGYHLTWRKAILCPCPTRESQQARPDCDKCDGSGFFYIEPLQIQAIMTSLERKKDIYRHLGEWLEGSSMATTEPEHRLGYRDSLEMTHSVMVFNEWLYKGNRRGIRSRLPAGVDSARYRIVRALHLFMEVDGVPVQLEDGVYYSINKNGWIEWQGPGLAIPDNTVISINYEFHPVWIVTTHPHGVRDTMVKLKEPVAIATPLPVQAAVRLDYLASDTTLPSTGVV